MPTDTDLAQELKPSEKALIRCGPCRPSEYGSQNVSLPNLNDYIDKNNNAPKKRGAEKGKG